MNYKSIIISLLAILLLGCGGSIKENTEKPVVMVSIVPQKYFVERVADTLVNVYVMVPPGSSPETYEPTPIQVKTLSKSSVYFSLGLLDFERSTLKNLQKQNEKTLFVSHSSELNLIEGHCHGHNHSDGHSHEHGFDPHVWSSPAEVRIMVNSIRETLSKLFPEHDSIFGANAKAFLSEIDSIDNHMKKSFEGLSTHKFFVFHPAFAYLARDYGLEQISLEEDGKSPSMRHMKSILQQARNEGVKTIFIQKEFDSKTAKTIAEDIGGKVVVIDPLEYDWVKSMHTITAQLKEAMGGE